jgi:hypothetical protein
MQSVHPKSGCKNLIHITNYDTRAIRSPTSMQKQVNCNLYHSSFEYSTVLTKHVLGLR